MPELARFYGLIIKMFFGDTEHNPPHIHILYGEFYATLDIEQEKITEGDLPLRAKKMALEWVHIHKTELLEIWNTQKFRAIKPLE